MGCNYSSSGYNASPDETPNRQVGQAFVDVERHKLEEELCRTKAELERYRTLYEHTPCIYLTVDLAGVFLSINQFGVAYLNYTVDELIERPLLCIVHPEDRESLQAEFTAFRQHLTQIRSWKFRLFSKDGSIFWIKARAKAVSEPMSDRLIQTSNTNTIILLVCEDIAEYVGEALVTAQAEEVLMATRERLQHLLTSSPSVIYSCKPSEGFHITFISENITSQLGYEVKDFIEDSSFWANHIHPDDAPHILAGVSRLFEEGRHTHEYRFLHKDGTYRWMHDELKLIKDARGQAIEIIGSWLDITSRKQAEEEKQKFVSLVENSNDFVAISSLEGKVIFVNEAGRKLVGLDSLEEALSKDISDYLSEQGWLQFYEIVLPKMIAEGWCEKESQLRHFKTGKLIDVQTSCSVVKHPQSGESMCFATIQRDITERKAVEATLRKLSSAVEQTADNVIITNKDGIIEYVNSAFEQLTGYTRKEVIGKTPRILKSGNHDQIFYQQLWEIILSGKVFRSVFINSKKNKELFYEEKTITPIRDAQGNITHFVSTGKDITERKQVEEKLIRIGKAVESASDAIGMADLVGFSIYHNQAFLDLFEYTTDELNAAGGPRVLYTDSNVAREVFETIGSGNSWSGEVEMRSRTGNTMLVLLRADAIKDDKNQLVALIGVHTDITERKLAEQQLKASLKEKEVLLKEVHHRVKNNLQVISSLLNIQSRYIEDKQTISIFKESQNRIQSMALIHEKLYQSKDLIKVDFAQYIRNLAMNLFHCYNVSEDLISLNINVNHVSLSINTAIPCGLITNELVSNALKYAFQEDVQGIIYIELSSNKDNIFTLLVGDNGIGLPEEIDMENPKSLGLRLVSTLVNQLKGNLEVDTSNGTIFKITFKELN